jgi:putative membrane protein
MTGGNTMTGFLLRCVITGLGLWLADTWIDGISIHSTTTLIFAAIVLGILNGVVRPVLFFLTLPLTIVTLGIFVLVLNAAMFGLAAAFFSGFEVTSFWAAVGGAIVVSMISWLASWFIGPKGRYEVVINRR